MNAMARPVTLLLCAATAVLPPASIGLDVGREHPLSNELVVVQVPASARPDSGGSTRLDGPLDRYVDGARIVRVDPGGGVAVLTPEFIGALDPDVSFDGQTVVFAGKRDAADSWQIWTMNADGSGKRQITRGPAQSVAPVFAGARFYLDDPQPTPQIIFARRSRCTAPISRGWRCTA
ncbi:MAG: hypothetical protein AMS20_17830 [Gemmatimonas sp. SG8_28]|nr:MAG: hypothetical protein AMS20_17830 [Gemmatimonas sp. SG8_28]